MIKNEFRFEYMIETLTDGTQFLHCLSYQNNCLIDDSNLGKVVDIMKENKQLNDNWNKLKEWLEKEGDKTLYILYEKVLIEMQELEKGGMNE